MFSLFYQTIEIKYLSTREGDISKHICHDLILIYFCVFSFVATLSQCKVTINFLLTKKNISAQLDYLM